nr:SOS response-associated peptidase family protein [Aurantiacibacter aquimixticola]
MPVITAGREFIAGPGSPRQPWRMVPRIWGVPPPPSAHDARPILNVVKRQSPFWVGNLRNPEFRCLVPATAFAEWGEAGADGKRRQHLFHCSDQPIFAMAGVWFDSEVPGFALLTCEPNNTVRSLKRECMPVILPSHRGAWATWLHDGWDRAAALLQPYSSSLMRESQHPSA